MKADSQELNPDSNSCQLEFYGASSPLPVYIVTQVISFDPDNADCWKALEKHGHLFCKDRFPCRILFIDSDKLGTEKSDPTMPNFEELKTVGIGEYTKLANGWQLCGARSCGWDRNGAAYGYFNSYP